MTRPDRTFELRMEGRHWSAPMDWYHLADGNLDAPDMRTAAQWFTQDRVDATRGHAPADWKVEVYDDYGVHLMTMFGDGTEELGR